MVSLATAPSLPLVPAQPQHVTQMTEGQDPKVRYITQMTEGQDLKLRHITVMTEGQDPKVTHWDSQLSAFALPCCWSINASPACKPNTAGSPC